MIRGSLTLFAAVALLTAGPAIAQVTGDEPASGGIPYYVYGLVSIVGCGAMTVRRLVKNRRERPFGWHHARGEYPEWEGRDSISNIRKTQAGFLVIIPGMFGLAALMVFLRDFLTGNVHDVFTWQAGLWAWALLAPAFWFFAVPDFDGPHWFVQVKESEVTFANSNGVRWAVPVDAVASVEAALTTQYTLTRGRYIVPPHEWHVFLYLRDGTRRAIYHANAARDDCAGLAASIRSEIEARRAAPKAPAPVAAGAAVEGFDL